jgi:hypothetical protein
MHDKNLDIWVFISQNPAVKKIDEWKRTTIIDLNSEEMYFPIIDNQVMLSILCDEVPFIEYKNHKFVKIEWYFDENKYSKSSTYK